LAFVNETNPLLTAIVKYHLDDVASKNYSKIAKALKESVEKITELVAKISALDPKPGRNFSVEEIQQVVPDIIIELTDEGKFKITINNENMPRIIISKTYRQMAKQPNLDPAAKEFLANKIKRAYEIMRAITRRQSTLRRVTETIVEIQQDAIAHDIGLLKPLTFRQVAQIIGMHESTVCRVVMNKYAQTPCGVYPLKDFFPSKLPGAVNENGEAVSSERIKCLIMDYIAAEDKKHPLSDETIVKLLREKNRLEVARRTIAKYRYEMKILPSSYRRTR